jgi:hypothetical protein
MICGITCCGCPFIVSDCCASAADAADTPTASATAMREMTFTLRPIAAAPPSLDLVLFIFAPRFFGPCRLV